MFGLTIYFSYGVTHSNAAKENMNHLFEPPSSTVNRALHEKKDNDGMKNECLLLSKRQNGLQPRNNSDASYDPELHEDKKYQKSANSSKTIIKNYNPHQNISFSSVTQDIPLDEPSHFSLEPHI